MNIAPDAETLFLSSLNELERYCHDSTFKLQRDIDDLNMQLISTLSTNSINISPDTQQKIQQVLFFEKKVEVFKELMMHVRYVFNNTQDLSSLPFKAPACFEALLWLLGRFDSMQYWQQIKNSIEIRFGKELVASLEKFNNIDRNAFERCFKFTFSEDLLRGYVKRMQDLYFPSQGNEAVNNNFLGYAPNVQQMPLQNAYTQVQQNSLNPPQSHDPFSLVNNFQPLGQQFGNQKPNYVYVKEEEKKVNIEKKSNLFDFNMKENGLQISVIKGVKKDNIEFYDQIQPALIASKELFTDETFPPIPTSITNLPDKLHIAQEAVWKRIPEIYPKKKITVCSDEISPNDIRQGRLGNCFFLSALSVLAEQKHYIKRLFHSKGISSTGCYSIWLCDSGEWKNILIDDYIPCTASKKGFIPKFSKSNGNDMWVLLLEKAYAKLYGSYFGTSTGYQGEALCALTGAPMKYFKIKNNGIETLDQLWLFLTGCLENKFVITVSSRKESETVNNKEMGVVSGHAYAVLDAKEVTLPDGTKQKIVKMRNPWGFREWTGEWGDNSPYWTPELKKALNYQPQATDGLFWISLADYHKHFFQSCVCKVHSEFGYSFIRLGENKKQSVFIAKMKVKSSGFAYVSVQQKRRKHFRNNPAYNYSNIRMMIATTDETGQITSFVHGKYKNYQSLVIKKNFTSGNYLILIEVDWMQNIFNEVVLSAYSGVEIEFQEEPLDKYHIPSLYSCLLKKYILNSGDPKVKETQLKIAGKTREAFKYYSSARFGFATFLFVNREKEATLNYKLKPVTLNNIEVYVPQTEAPQLYIMVPPGEDRIVLLKAKITQMGNLTYGHKLEEAYVFNTFLSPERLKQLCLENKKKVQDFKNGQAQVLMHSYGGGIALYYINNSQGMLTEDVLFEAPNVLLNGEDRNSLQIFIPPGEDFILDAKSKNVFEKTTIKKISRATLLE